MVLIGCDCDLQCGAGEVTGGEAGGVVRRTDQLTTGLGGSLTAGLVQSAIKTCHRRYSCYSLSHNPFLRRISLRSLFTLTSSKSLQKQELPAIRLPKPFNKYSQSVL